MIPMEKENELIDIEGRTQCYRDSDEDEGSLFSLCALPSAESRQI